MVIKRLSAADVEGRALALRIHAAIEQEKALSHRSAREVLKHARRGEVFALYEGSALTSFLFATPLANDTVELHALYTFPGHRRRGHMGRLLDELCAQQAKTFLAVTFHDHSRRLLRGHGFREVAFAELPLSVRVRFLTRRLSLWRLISIALFVRGQGRPIYLVKDHVTD